MLNSVEIASFLIDFHRVCYHYSSSSMAKKTHTSPQKWYIAFMMPRPPPNNSGQSPTPDMPTHIPISRKSIRKMSRNLLFIVFHRVQTLFEPPGRIRTHLCYTEPSKRMTFFINHTIFSSYQAYSRNDFVL